jgi:hypothetical protein
LLLLRMPMLARGAGRTVFAHRPVERNYHEGFWFQEGLMVWERQKAFTTPKPFTIMTGIAARCRMARSGRARLRCAGKYRRPWRARRPRRPRLLPLGLAASRM